MEKIINIPGRLHSVSTDKIVVGADEVKDDKRGKTQQDVNDELYEVESLTKGYMQTAQREAEQSKYYNELTQEAFGNLSEEDQNILTYSQAIVKHGRAIEKIAEQLNATYVNNSREVEDEYTPGYIFEEIEKEDMDALLEAGTTVDNKLYLVIEPEDE